MIRLAIIVLCALPLGIFTTRVVVDELEGNTVGPEDAAPGTGREVLPADVRRVEQAIRERAEVDLKFIEATVDFDPIGTSEPPDLAATPDSGRYSKSRESLETLSRARKAAAEYVALYRFPLEAEGELEALKKFLEEHPLETLPGSQQLANVVGGRIRELEQEQARKQMLASAEEAFKARRYAECLEKLAGIARDGKDRATIDRAGELEVRAKFKDHWKGHQTRPDDAKGELQQIRSLLRSMPVSPADAADQDELAGYERREKYLVGRVAVEDLHAQDHQDVAAYSEQALAILTDYPEHSAMVAGRFKTWLRSRLKEQPEPEYPRNLMESTTRQGFLVRGVFLPGDGSTPPKWYKYWKTVEDYRNNQPPTTRFAQELKATPDLPLDLRCVRRFNGSVKRLGQRMGDRLQWLEFDDACRKLTEDLQGYEAQPALPERISFSAEQSFAAAVLDAWENVEALLKHSDAAL